MVHYSPLESHSGSAEKDLNNLKTQLNGAPVEFCVLWSHVFQSGTHFLCIVHTHSNTQVAQFTFCSWFHAILLINSQWR